MAGSVLAHALTLCMLVAASSSAALAGKESLLPPGGQSEVLISYSAPFRRIVLTEDLRIVDTEELAEYDNPVADVPSKIVTVEKSTVASPAEVSDLLSFIRKSGFSQLRDFSGASPKERSYPYAILVRDKGKEKQVVHRESPHAEERPEAFSRVEEKIKEFARKAVEIKTGG